MTEDTTLGNLRSRVARVLVLLCVSGALAVGLGFPVAGALTGGTLRANFAFALLVMSVLLDLAVMSSYGSSLRMQQIARSAWLVVAITCLAFAQYLLILNYTDANKAADTVLITSMLILTFPAGIIGLGMTVLYSIFFLSHRVVDSLDVALIWLFFFMVGYLQWFTLIPFLFAKLGMKVSNGSRIRGPT